MGLFKIAHFWNWIQGLFSRNIYGFRFKTKNKKTPPWFTLKMTQLIFKMSPPTISVGHDRSISSYASDWFVDQPIRNRSFTWLVQFKLLGPSTLSGDFVHNWAKLLIGQFWSANEKPDFPQVQVLPGIFQSDNNYHFSNEKRMKYYPINSTGFRN